MRSPRPRSGEWILPACSVVVALLLCELYLRWAPPPGVYLETRNIVQQTHSEPSANPGLAYLPKANLVKRFKNREFDTTIRINSSHMRDREYSLAKPPGVKRIVAVGDSFVFGWGVENEEMFTRVLGEAYLRRVEVLNMGVSGYWDNQKLERLKTDGVRFEPDLALFFVSDYPSVVDPHYRFDGETMYWSSVRRDRVSARTRSFLARNVYLYSFLRHTDVRLTKGAGRDAAGRSVETPSAPPVALEEGAGIVSGLKELAREKKFVLIVVYFPSKEAFERGADPTAETTIRLLEQYCRDRGCGFLDLSPPLREYRRSQGRSPYFRYDDHWNADGHRVVARAVARYLKDNGPLEPARFRF